MAIKRIKWATNNLHDWELARREMEGIGQEFSRFGASDVSVITGSNKWKCPARLFYHSVGYHSSFEMTERTVAGHLIEPIIQTRWEGWEEDQQQFFRNALSGHKNRALKKADFFLLNSKYPQLFVSMDYIPKGKSFSPFTGLQYHPLTPHEMKHTTESYYKLWPKYKEWDGRITQSYNEQVHAQMMVSGTDVAVFLVLVDGVKFIPIEIDRDKVLCEKIDHDTRVFEGKVQVGKMIVSLMNDCAEDDIVQRQELEDMFHRTAPDPIGTDDNKDLISEIYKRGNGLELIGNEQDEVDMSRYLELGEQIKSSEEEKLLLRNTLTTKAGRYEYLIAGDRKLINRRGLGGKKPYFAIR